ncbi:MAG: hypothetical protein Q8S19_01020, partial [Bacillota bacterium]|nr:hypothetical protein [Bacillota bacterium]
VFLDLCQPVSEVKGVGPGVASLHLANEVTSGIPGVGGAGAGGKFVDRVVGVGGGYAVFHLLSAVAHSVVLVAGSIALGWLAGCQQPVKPVVGVDLVVYTDDVACIVLGVY